MRVARRVPLGPNGAVIPVNLGGIEADWVAEGNEKHKTEGDIGIRTIVPKKLAAIAVVSEEVVRSNVAGYMDLLYSELAGAFARAFDMAALFGLSGTGHSTGPFDVDLLDTTHEYTVGTGTTMYNDIVGAAKLMVEGNHGIPTGILLSEYARWLLMDEIDGVNRPLFQNLDNIAGLPITYSPHAGFEHHLGFVGDFTKCAWGAVGGINFTVSNEASVTVNGSLVSLFEKNLVAVRAEAEYGFVVSNTTASHFVKLHSSGDLGTLGTPMGYGTL
jgi:HK97 family phage major capsid protein